MKTEKTLSLVFFVAAPGREEFRTCPTRLSLWLRTTIST